MGMFLFLLEAGGQIGRNEDNAELTLQMDSQQ